MSVERPACHTCVFHNDDTRVCGVYGIPANIARMRGMLCGEEGVDHLTRPGRLAFVESWGFLAFVGGVIACIAYVRLRWGA